MHAPLMPRNTTPVGHAFTVAAVPQGLARSRRLGTALLRAVTLYAWAGKLGAAGAKVAAAGRRVRRTAAKFLSSTAAAQAVAGVMPEWLENVR